MYLWGSYPPNYMGRWYICISPPPIASSTVELFDRYRMPQKRFSNAFKLLPPSLDSSKGTFLCPTTAVDSAMP